MLSGRIQQLKNILQKPDININYTFQRGEQTPLLLACQLENSKVIDLLLEEERLDVNQCNINGDNPLSWVCEKGKTKIAKKILESGKPISTSMLFKGLTLLEIAQQENQKSIFEMLLDFITNGYFLIFFFFFHFFKIIF